MKRYKPTDPNYQAILNSYRKATAMLGQVSRAKEQAAKPLEVVEQDGQTTVARKV